MTANKKTIQEKDAPTLPFNEALKRVWGAPPAPKVTPKKAPKKKPAK